MLYSRLQSSPRLQSSETPAPDGSQEGMSQITNQVDPSCTRASADQSAVTICGCGQQLPGTQQVQPTLLTRGDQALAILRYLDFPRSEVGLNLLSTLRSESKVGVEYH